MKNIQIITYLILTFFASSCKKDFLDAKPSTNLIVPQTLDDFKSLLDNSSLNYTSALGHLSSDEYVFLNYSTWQAASAIERNSYIWSKDIYDGGVEINDWYLPYKGIFYANCVLSGLQKLSTPDKNQYNQIKGWALFTRAFTMYDLTRTFCVAYSPLTASADLGIPIRLNPEIDEFVPRATLQESYDRVLTDLKLSCRLLSAEFQQIYRNRPSKIAAYALLARIYLSMNNYDQAELYADSSLTLYNKLIDYNTISATSAIPFNNLNEETIFNTCNVLGYNVQQNSVGNAARVNINPEIIESYSLNDLRLSVYFGKTASGIYYRKTGYFGGGVSPFSGLATDELYLIKSECLARRDQINPAMDWLNMLLKKRFKNSVPYVPISAANKVDAITKILLERRKELIWRSIRWSDIKRLNQIGESITLKRILNGVEYTLSPKDKRYAMPIPDDEIGLSKIIQNER